MHIVCPHCTTSYAIKLASLGTGRTVRCSRCKETWVARPEDAISEIQVSAPAMAAASPADDQSDLAAQWNSYANEETAAEAPVVESPSIASDWPSEDSDDTKIEDDWSRADAEAADKPHHQSWFRGLFSRRARVARPEAQPAAKRAYVGLPVACAGMGALILALAIWRADMVRLLPQTAAFYRLVGLEVNLRGLAFKDIKVSSETVDGKQVLVIEGVIVGQTRKAVEIPRLRFAVRDAQGAEIYAWNAVLEQTVLHPGERAVFKSRLASPPAEGRNIDIRFFNRRDIAGGSV
jgi:predicted Zn finger-like uncharacterized protein